MRDYDHLGSIVRVRRLGQADMEGGLDDPESIVGSTLPALLGGGAAILTTVGIRHLMKPTTDMQMNMAQYAPWIGLGSGLLTSLSLAWLAGQPAAWQAATASIVVTTGLMLSEWAARKKFNQIASGEQLDVMAQYGLGPNRIPANNAGAAGVRAIVPEYAGTSGLAAVVMEPHAARGYGSGTHGVGAYGDTVNLQGVRGISSGAFGTPGFNV